MVKRCLHSRTRNGIALIYCAVAMTVFLGLASLAADLGRVQLAKYELQQAADAAARYTQHGAVR